MKHYHYIRNTMTIMLHSHGAGQVYHEHISQGLVSWGVTERDLAKNWRMRRVMN